MRFVHIKREGKDRNDREKERRSKLRRLITVEPEKCNGCRVCELICSLSQEKEVNPEKSRIRVLRKEADGTIFALPLLCRQCEVPECLDACPAEAISRDAEKGLILINDEECLGCGACIQACPIGAIAVNNEKGVAFLCDLCAGEPKCVDFCHSGCLRYEVYEEGNERHRREYLEQIIKAEGLKVSPPKIAKKAEEKRDFLRGGTILRIDLSTGEITKELTSSYSESFIGGRGINIKLLYDNVAPKTGALSPKNALIFGVGPLTGTTFPGSSRTNIMTKSPLTNILGESSLGGYWGPELKFAGYDHVVVQGKAQKPCYIFIQDDEVQIREVSDLWGKDCYESQAMIREELGDPRVQVICIGPAGENLVHFASIHTCFGNTGARSGLGAVMGSKNLKAIAVRGTKGIEIANPDQFFEECADVHKLIKESSHYEELHTYGVTREQDMLIRYGADWEEAEKASGGAFVRENLYRKESCFGCPIACMESYRIAGIGNGIVNCGPYIDFTYGPRNTDMTLFWQCYLLCQRMGIDSRTCASLLSSLMHMYNEEVIYDRDIDGLRLEWGEREFILKMMEKIIQRDGIGNVLADGALAAVKHFGEKSEPYFVHTKGSPYQVGISTQIKGFALSSVVSSSGDGVEGFSGIEFGTIFLPGLNLGEEETRKMKEKFEAQAELLTGTRKAADPAESEGKAALVYHTENASAIADIMGICAWDTPIINMPVTPEVQAKLFSIGSGRELGVEKLLEVSKRVKHLERAFLAREGITRKDDSLPKKFLEGGPKGKGKAFLTESDLDRMKDEYYALRGWDIGTGVPTRATLEQFDLKEVADDLEGQGKLPG